MRREADSWDDDMAAEVYAEIVRDGCLYNRLAEDLVELLDPKEGERFLDFAAGSGLVSARLAARVGACGMVVGVDRALAMVSVARREHPETEKAFLVGTGRALPFAMGFFDGASCSAALWHLPALGRTLGELSRVLRPGASFAFNVPASQLRGVRDLPPAPLQLALARVGEHHFGSPPEPAGPVRGVDEILALGHEAGMKLEGSRWIDFTIVQQELIDLLTVPAISARLYPEASEEARTRWLEASVARVDPGETLRVRWWEVVLRCGGAHKRSASSWHAI